MAHLAQITRYSHFFTLKTQDQRYIREFVRLADKYTERRMMESRDRGKHYIQGNIFASYNKPLGTFVAHRKQLDELETSWINAGLSLDLIDYVDVPYYKPNTYDYNLVTGRVPRDYQIKASAFAWKAFEIAPHTAMIGMPTGTGKTVTLCNIATQVKENFSVAVLPKYMEKWGEDIVANLGFKHKDVMLVSKSTNLAGLIDMVKSGKKPPHTMVFSLKTLTMYFDAYESDPVACVAFYGCAPWEMWGLLKIGLLGIDETHEHFHAVYRLVTNLHGPKLVGLSGTLLSERSFEDMVQRVVFPNTIRFMDIKMKRYIRAFQYMYSIRREHMKFIRTTERGRSTYSQNAFEKSIYKHPELLRNYIQMQKDIVQVDFLDNYMEGDTMLVYASTNMMCSILTNALTKWLGHRFKVKRYVDDDPYENIIDSDICVTSIIKAGAAIDKPKLRYLLTTISVSSHKAVLQLLGRLRELTDREVCMAYLLCSGIDKHMKYAANVRELVLDRVASIRPMRLSNEI